MIAHAIPRATAEITRPRQPSMNNERSRVGFVVAVRTVPRGLQLWDYLPRRIAVIALDDGQWCFAWIVGGHFRRGARVHFIDFHVDDKYPTFSLFSRAHQNDR